MGFPALLLSLIIFCISASAAENIIVNGNFETGTTSGWFPFGSDLIITVETTSHGGNFSAQVAGRSQNWQGLAQSILNRLEVGKTYELTAWVMLEYAPGGNDTIKATIKKVENEDPATYPTVAQTTGTNNVWVQLSGEYTLTVDGVLTELILYFEGPAAGVSYYLDDVVFKEKEEEEPNDWTKEANQRIEQYRKRNALIRVVDPLGEPFEGVDVDIEQTKHLFAFGSAINYRVLNNPSYARFFKEHFEWAACENETKWVSNEPSRDYETYQTADQIYNWCKANGIIMRGHTIFWEQENYALPGWVQDLSYEPYPAPSELLDEVDERIISAVNHFKGKFVQWDVDNEMLSDSFFNRLGGDTARVHMFQLAHQIDPDCKLYMNEYSGNSFGGYDGWGYVYRAYELLSNEAPIHGLGIQGHVSPPFSPQRYFDDVLEPLSLLGLPILVTEFDIPQADENLRADDLENFYRICFSHPSVEGILMWGFWMDAWRWEGIANPDWTINRAGRRYEKLMDDWTTKESKTTDAWGNTSFRGFHGTYKITLSLDGEPIRVEMIELVPGDTLAQYTIVLNMSGEPSNCDIDLNATNQTIRGFGGMNFPRWIGTLTDAQVDRAFGNDSGQIGLTIMRIDVPPDSSYWSGEVSAAQRAINNHGAIVVASPWSPPADMKTNDDLVGGELRADAYGDYANHLTDFADYMSSNGAPLYAISLQNEPDISVNYESCDWSSTQMRNFLKNNASVIPTRVMVAESFNFNKSFTDPILNDAAAEAQLEIIAGHIYGGGLSDYPLARNKGKEIFMTEHYTSSNVSGDLWPDALEVGTEIHDCMTANMNAYIWWYIRRSYGPIDESGNVSKRGYVMSQYAKFVRPGYIRVNATASPSFGVYVTAYKTGETLVIVAINQNSSSSDVTFSLSGGNVSSYTKYETTSSNNVSNQGSVGSTNTLAANSINTFVGTVQAAEPDGFQNCSEVHAGGYGLTSDLNADCYVDYGDLRTIADYWLYTDCDSYNDCEGADSEADNDVDFADFSSFGMQWMNCNDPEDPACTSNW